MADAGKPGIMITRDTVLPAVNVMKIGDEEGGGLGESQVNSCYKPRLSPEDASEGDTHRLPGTCWTVWIPCGSMFLQCILISRN